MIWLIGNKGMLGNDVEKLLKKNNLSYVASDKEVGVTNYQILKEFIKKRTKGVICPSQAYLKYWCKGGRWSRHARKKSRIGIYHYISTNVKSDK